MSRNSKRQQGSALVVAIFVIVVIFGLVLAMSRILLSSSESLVYEVLGTRALFAAQSGLELAATELFSVAAANRVCPETNQIYWFTEDGLTNCRAEVVCELPEVAGQVLEFELDDGRSGRMFMLTSTGACRSQAGWSPSCSSDELCASRKLLMEVF